MDLHLDGATVYLGDCVQRMREMADGSAQMCVTSPPYFGLRDYGHDGQIGLEDTPEQFIAKLVEVFREVRRVLADDGTLWVNMGDSYNSGTAKPSGASKSADVGGWTTRSGDAAGARRVNDPTCKVKDLMGIPWALAKALRDPYYTGPVKDVCDQVWLAAMLDAEGSICGTEYQSGDRTKTNLYISITNTSVPIIEKCDRLFPQEIKHIYEKTNWASGRKCFRWDVERMDQKSMFIRTIYPHLVAKRKQAIIGYTFIEMQRGLVSKKKGYLSEQHEQRSWLMKALSMLNSGQDVDLPDWVIEPPSLFEPGYYLRQDIIWHKPNPMPESVTDRCTKSHEYLFLLSKSPRYFYDHDAIKEDAVRGHAGSTFNNGKTAEHQLGRSSDAERADDGKRNKRSVWTIATRPYKGAHFAVFPPALVEPCILAGSRPGDTVLDPFNGSGTTGQVALEHGRQYVGYELNAEYIALTDTRLSGVIAAKAAEIAELAAIAAMPVQMDLLATI